MPVTSTYLLDDLPVEIDRLISVAEVLAPEVRATCERAGLGHGGRAVDVGCGPLGALGVLGDIVGPGGEVVGVDASPASVATAKAVLDRRGASRVRLLAADINTVDLDMIGPAASFDLVFSRLTLMHQPDPGETLRRFYQLLRPGGAVVAFDLFEPPVTDPGYPPLHNAWRLLLEGMQRRGAHPETSRRYNELARAADLEVVSQRGVFSPVPPIVTLSETTMLLGSGAPIPDRIRCRRRRGPRRSHRPIDTRPGRAPLCHHTPCHRTHRPQTLTFDPGPTISPRGTIKGPSRACTHLSHPDVTSFRALSALMTEPGIDSHLGPLVPGQQRGLVTRGRGR